MRVLQVINSLSTGGAEKLILDTVPLYQQKGIVMDVLCLTDSKSSFMYELKAKTSGEIFALSDGSVYNPLHIFRITPYLRKYDIIHLHLFPTLYWVVLAKWISFSNVKLVYTEHNTHNRRRGNLIFKMLDRFIYTKLDKIAAITHGVKDELQKHIGNKNNIEVINNGIDVKSFNLNEIPVFDFFVDSDFILIQVSSFREQKDQATIIRSLKLLPEKVKLLLVGNGQLIDDNKRLTEQLGLSGRVLFLGNRYDIPELMNYADVAILSSHWEGFGLAVLEGMAAGKPAIASDVDGIREIVNGYGILFEHGNERELAEKITNLLNDNNYYVEVAEKCYQRAQQFDINKMVDNYIELYKEVVNT